METIERKNKEKSDKTQELKRLKTKIQKLETQFKELQQTDANASDKIHSTKDDTSKLQENITSLNSRVSYF